jgi:hypothetical protein
MERRRTLGVLEAGATEKFGQKWFDLRRNLRELLRRAREIQEELGQLEQSQPWLGSFKGMIRKDGQNSDLPERPKAPRAAPTREKSPVHGPSEEAPRVNQGRSGRSGRPPPNGEIKEASAKKKRLQPPVASAPTTPGRAATPRDLSDIPLSVLEEALASRKNQQHRESWESSIAPGESEGGFR